MTRLDGAAPQIDTTAMDGGRVPSVGLLYHLARLIDTRDIPRWRPFQDALDHRSGSETNLQDAISRSNFENVR